MNPLNRRILRSLRDDAGKYIVIFIFMVLLVSFISGYLISDNSCYATFEEGMVKQNVEDGHLAFNVLPDEELIEEIEQKGDVTLHELYYFDEDLAGSDKTVRVYSTERDVNLIDLMSGELPTEADEIAIDRMFAQNNEIEIGDTIILKDTELKVTGLVAFPDYGALFENNSDAMFDAISFCVGAMSEEGFEAFDTVNLSYNYAWTYPQAVDWEDSQRANELSNDFIEVLGEVIEDYDISLLTEGKAADELIELSDYLPRYLNQAIMYAGEDMGSDKAFAIMLDYIVTIILAFVFAVTASSTITSESGVIGTLRALGYTKREIIVHYMALPIMVSLVAAVIGNILGYTVLKDVFVALYYNSYSLASYKALFNLDAFVLTTVIPLIIMLVVNFLMLIRKLRLSPLRFLRHDLTRHRNKKALRLNTKIPFIQRFRLRIILQNLSNYLILFFGVFIGGILMVFGDFFNPMFDEYKEMIIEDRICDYQYVLNREAETENDQAEKYCVTSLNTTDERYKEDSISVIAPEEESEYISASLVEGEAVISSSIAEKYTLDEGDEITLKDEYDENKQYTFKIGGVYDYVSSMAIFITQEDFCERFDEEEGYFNGYFSNEELDDIADEDIAKVITVTDLTKLSDQMIVSMGSAMNIFKYFVIALFIVLMFILIKQIIEKNVMSISMSKILGYSNGEIGGLYVAASSVMVLLSLLISIPLINEVLRIIITSYMYTRMTGYLPFIVGADCYIRLVIVGLICYIVVAAYLMRRISKIPKSDALKNVE